MSVLRDYQLKSVDDIRSALISGKRRPIIVLPTGAGKGEILATITKSACANGKRVVFIVPRRELVRDFSRRLHRYGVNHGIFLGAQTRQTHLSATVASIDTLNARAKRGRCPKYDIVILDEAHLSVSDRYSNVIEAMGNPIVIGASATPQRLDGKGLGNVFDCIIPGPTVSELTERGYLVPARVFAPSIPELTGVHVVGGDYNQEELGEMMDNSRVIADVVDTWGRLGRGRPSVGFFVNLRHSQHTCEKFVAMGVRAVHVDGDTPDAERDRVWRGLETGDIQYVCSVGIISLGWDVPCVSYESQACPTKSLAKYLQQAGRILRTSEGKTDAILADHAGNCIRHGFPDDEREWTLANRRRKTRNADEELAPEQLPRVCPECKRVCRPVDRYCPCGYVFAALPVREIEQIDGELKEITERPKYAEAAYGASEDPAIQRIIEAAKKRGNKPGQVYVLSRQLEEARTKYRESLGIEPKQHWGAAQLSAMVERSLANV